MRTYCVVPLVLLLNACAGNPYSREAQASKTAKGAGIGAATGAVFGTLTGDDSDECSLAGVSVNWPEVAWMGTCTGRKRSAVGNCKTLVSA